MHDAADQCNVFYERGGIVVGIREYLISVVAAAIFCGAIKTLLRDNTAAATLIRTLCGVFLCMILLQPIANFQIDLSDVGLSLPIGSAGEIANQAAEYVKEQETAIIKQRLQTYICDKAQQYSCQLESQVVLQAEAPYAPIRVTLTGSASPYVKKQLSLWIQEQLGIPQEAQVWIGQS
jgi:hypothetical protein